MNVNKYISDVQAFVVCYLLIKRIDNKNELMYLKNDLKQLPYKDNKLRFFLKLFDQIQFLANSLHKS